MPTTLPQSPCLGTVHALQSHQGSKSKLVLTGLLPGASPRQAITCRASVHCRHPTSDQWQLVNPVHEARGCPDSYKGGDSNANDCWLLVCLVPLGLQACVASMINFSGRQP